MEEYLLWRIFSSPPSMILGGEEGRRVQTPYNTSIQAFLFEVWDQEIIRYFENPPWLEKILKIDDRKCPEKGRITVMCWYPPFLIKLPPF